MTEKEFIDNQKKRGWTIYRCMHCDFRGWGADVSWHTLNHPSHNVVNEDKLNKTENKNE